MQVLIGGGRLACPGREDVLKVRVVAQAAYDELDRRAFVRNSCVCGRDHLTPYRVVCGEIVVDSVVVEKCRARRFKILALRGLLATCGCTPRLRRGEEGVV